MSGFKKEGMVKKFKERNRKKSSKNSPKKSHRKSFIIKRNSYNDDGEEYISEDEEDEVDYRIGGYHPVVLGDKFKNGRYVILRKLGWGHFSTVWLAEDTLKKSYVALKIVKSEKKYTETALDEIKLLEKINTADPEAIGREFVTVIYDSFQHTGPFGKHMVMVFEVLGENLLTVIRKFDHQGIPLNIVKRVSKQILAGLDYMHRICGIIHTDLKPENVLLGLDEEKMLERFSLKRLDSFKNTRKEKTLPEGSSPSKIPLVKSLSDISLEKEDQSSAEVSSLKRSQVPDQSIKGKLEPPTKRSNSPKKIVKSSLEHESSDKSSKVDAKLSRCSSNESIITSRLLQTNVKIADLGNACWVDHHFTSSIQTRQYRSPEAIIVADYDESTDLWSFACMVFELLTGDYLFDPSSSSKFGKDDDHLAQIWELVGDFPKNFALKGKYSLDFFNRKGQLRYIHKLKIWKLEDVLREKYEFSNKEAKEAAEFLCPMLEIDPKKRPKAKEMLNHPWLSDFKLEN